MTVPTICIPFLHLLLGVGMHLLAVGMRARTTHPPWRVDYRREVGVHLVANEVCSRCAVPMFLSGKIDHAPFLCYSYSMATQMSSTQQYVQRVADAWGCLQHILDGARNKVGPEWRESF